MITEELAAEVLDADRAVEEAAQTLEFSPEPTLDDAERWVRALLAREDVLAKARKELNA